MTGKIGISDHALVRWLQRSGAMDMEAMKAMLAASLERAVDAAASMGGAAGSHAPPRRYLILADGLVFIMEGSVLVTVHDDDGRHAAIFTHPGRQ